MNARCLRKKQMRCLIEPSGKSSVADLNADGVYINVTGVASASKAVVVRTLHGAIAGDKMKMKLRICTTGC
jgi:hypothetical protein